MTLLLGFGREARLCYWIAVSYRQAVPYSVRYLVAVMAWALIVAADLLLRACFLPFMPILWLRQWQSQPDAQITATTADFLYRPLMRFPKHRLFPRHRGNGGARNLIQ